VRASAPKLKLPRPRGLTTLAVFLSVTGTSQDEVGVDAAAPSDDILGERHGNGHGTAFHLSRVLQGIRVGEGCVLALGAPH